MDNNQKSYIFSASFGVYATDIESAREQAQTIIDQAESSPDLTLIDGTVATAKEREVVEMFSFGSKQPFYNSKALQQESLTQR